MKPATTHIILHENGDHRHLSHEQPPSEGLLAGAAKSIESQGRAGAYVARQTGTARDGTLSHVATIGSPHASFDEAKARFKERNGMGSANGGIRANPGNPVASNVNG